MSEATDDPRVGPVRILVVWSVLAGMAPAVEGVVEWAVRTASPVAPGHVT